MTAFLWFYDAIIFVYPHPGQIVSVRFLWLMCSNGIIIMRMCALGNVLGNGFASCYRFWLCFTICCQSISYEWQNALACLKLILVLRTRPGGVDCNRKLYIVKEHYRLGRRWDWLQKRNVIWRYVIADFLPLPPDNWLKLIVYCVEAISSTGTKVIDKQSLPPIPCIWLIFTHLYTMHCLYLVQILWVKLNQI